MTKTAYVRQLNGITLAGRTESDHWVVMDGPRQFGGSEAGPRPKELVLLALAGCTASDVAVILQKKRVTVEALEVLVTAEEAEDHPKVFTAIHLEFVVRGEHVREADVARAIELSDTKYCPVGAMLRGNVAITHSVRVEAPAAVA